VSNGLPGETVDVRLVHVGRTTAEVRIEHVVVASPDRVADACPHGAVCPGCGLRTTSAAARRSFLRERVVTALAKEGLAGVTVLETVAAPVEDGWRHKAFLTARRTSRGVFLGLYEEHSHRLLGIDGCPAHAQPVERALYAVRQALARTNPSIYDERSKEGWLRYVAVRASSTTGEALVTFVATGRDFAGEQALMDLIRRLAPHVSGFVVNVHEAPGNAPFGPRFAPLAGNAHLIEKSGPFEVRVSAGSFFQVNPAMGERLHDAVARAARTAPAGPALDLYGGVGCTALRLASDGRAVTLVESFGSAAEDAAWNGRGPEGGTPAFEVRAERVESALASGTIVPPTVVVVNPPRSGLSAEVLERVRGWKPALLLYVACDPRPLARDLATLTRDGAVVESVEPFEMMPQTSHVEALAIVRRPA
jgi:23S rRNA (uracil1939-C5)-methyltransferase